MHINKCCPHLKWKPQLKSFHSGSFLFPSPLVCSDLPQEQLILLHAYPKNKIKKSLFVLVSQPKNTQADQVGLPWLTLKAGMCSYCNLGASAIVGGSKCWISIDKFLPPANPFPDLEPPTSLANAIHLWSSPSLAAPHFRGCDPCRKMLSPPPKKKMVIAEQLNTHNPDMHSKPAYEIWFENDHHTVPK